MNSQEHMNALRRLWLVAQGCSGQCRTVAAFLLGLYNGNRFPFDLTDLRGLDTAIFEDCIAVLRLDNTPKAEVHVLLGLPGQAFETMAEEWRIKDHSR